MEQISFFTLPAPGGIGERWKVIEDCPDYWVSDKGRIYNSIKNRTVRTFLDRDGRSAVTLLRRGQKRTRLVDRTVADHFVDNPKGYGYVRHKSGDWSDNTARNLEWVAYPTERPVRPQAGHAPGRVHGGPRPRQYS